MAARQQLVGDQKDPEPNRSRASLKSITKDSNIIKGATVKEIEDENEESKWKEISITRAYIIAAKVVLTMTSKHLTTGKMAEIAIVFLIRRYNVIRFQRCCGSQQQRRKK